MHSIGRIGESELSHLSPRGLTAVAGLTAQDVPQASHKVGADGYEHRELEEAQGHSSGGDQREEGSAMYKQGNNVRREGGREGR